MMDDHIAIVEAWTRKKPRRIIQNQFLIEMILAYALPVAMVFVMATLYFVSIYPMTMTLILAVWVVSAVCYLGLLLVRKRIR